MNRRDLLAGTAALPVAALPIGAAARPVNGTDQAWPAYLDAKAAVDAAERAANETAAALPAEFRSENRPTVMVQHGSEAPRAVHSKMALEAARECDPIIAARLGGPEVVAARQAHYDRLSANLAQQSAAYKTGRVGLDALDEALEKAVEQMGDAEDAVLSAPLLTVTDAVRKLTVVERFLDTSDMPGRVTAETLDGLRRLIA